MNSDAETKCLNCGAPLIGAFCHSCGQSASVHRFSVSSFLTHDVVHGIWHVDKGILFTIKEILIRPGYAARDYITGKRRSYFNVLTLAVFIIASILFVSSKFEGSSEFVVRKANGDRLDDVVLNNLKLILFSFIPVFALCGWLFFKRLKYNYAEHLVATIFFFNGFMILALLQKLFTFFVDYDYVTWFPVSFSVQIGFLFFADYQFVKGRYSIPGSLWRIVGSLVLFTFISLFIALSIFAALGLEHFGWESK